MGDFDQVDIYDTLIDAPYKNVLEQNWLTIRGIYQRDRLASYKQLYFLALFVWKVEKPNYYLLAIIIQ